MLRSAELLILPPGDAPETADEFVGRCVIGGVDFYSEPGDALPVALPRGIAGLRGIMIDITQMEANAEVLAEYRNAGVSIYPMSRDNLATWPNATLSWKGEKGFHAIGFDADLTIPSARALQKMAGRDEERLVAALAERIVSSANKEWYDATRYQWDGMIDAYEMFGNRRYLETAHAQMRHMMQNVPNDLTNCDTVAPFAAMLRVYEINQDDALLRYVAEKFDRYIEITPKFRGGFVNFSAYPNHVRSEILWQVLPGLVHLAHITGNKRYMNVTMEQFEILHEQLFDRAQGLWNHGCNSSGRSPGFWARSVSLGVYGTLAVIERGDKNHRAYALAESAYQQSIARLAELQDDAGFWPCYVDMPDSQRESSGTAWNCALLWRGLYLDVAEGKYRDTAERAWNAVKSRVWKGDFPGHMTATTISKQKPYYVKKQLLETGWAHFAFRAAAERYRALHKTL